MKSPCPMRRYFLIACKCCLSWNLSVRMRTILWLVRTAASSLHFLNTSKLFLSTILISHGDRSSFQSLLLQARCRKLTLLPMLKSLTAVFRSMILGICCTTSSYRLFQKSFSEVFSLTKNSPKGSLSSPLYTQAFTYLMNGCTMLCNTLLTNC